VDALRVGSNRLVLSAAALTACLAVLGRARAEGFEARAWRVATDPEGVGTLDGAHAPRSGSVVLALASDFAREPVSKRQAGVSDEPLAHRLSVEPAAVFGLPSMFAVIVRAPFVAHDKGYETSGRALATAGALSPSVGVLVPIARDAATDARVAARAQVAFPVGRQEAFRSDGAVTGRLGLVYGGPVGPVFTLLSGGLELAPSRGYQNATLSNALLAGVGIRVPRAPPVGAVASADARFQTDGSYRPSALASGGLDIRVGGTSVRALGGVGVGETAGTPRFWVGVAWTQSIELFPGFYAPATR
jgi:hypothetical protein